MATNPKITGIQFEETDYASWMRATKMYMPSKATLVFSCGATHTGRLSIFDSGQSRDVLSLFDARERVQNTKHQTQFQPDQSGFHKTRVFLSHCVWAWPRLERGWKGLPEAMAGPTPFKLESAPIAASRSFLLKMALNAFLLSWMTTLGVFIWIKSFSRGRNTPRWIIKLIKMLQKWRVLFLY